MYVVEYMYMHRQMSPSSRGSATKSLSSSAEIMYLDGCVLPAGRFHVPCPCLSTCNGGYRSVAAQMAAFRLMLFHKKYMNEHGIVIEDSHCEGPR